MIYLKAHNLFQVVFSSKKSCHFQNIISQSFNSYFPYYPLKQSFGAWELWKNVKQNFVGKSHFLPILVRDCVSNAGTVFVMVSKMAHLQFYVWEREAFKDAYDRKLNEAETKMLFKKLTKHYKINNCSFYWKNKARGCGSYIIMPKRWSSIGVLCHELSHVIQCRKGNKRHNKQMKTTFKRLVNYCRRKNFWQEELTRRTEVKVKIEPTIDQLQSQKIEKRKTDLMRYEKRLAYFTKLYSTKIKKARRSIAMLEKHGNKTKA